MLELNMEFVPKKAIPVMQLGGER